LEPYQAMTRWAVARWKKPVGHSIFYGWRGYDDVDPADEDKLFVQPWVRKLNKQQLQDAMKRHLEKLLTTFAGQINDYILNNEVMGSTARSRPIITVRFWVSPRSNHTSGGRTSWLPCPI
jgi:hypothetical protein